MTARVARVPPGAAQVARVRRQGYAPKNRGVEVVLSWGWPRLPMFGVVRVIVPDREDPHSFDWFWVRGLDVVLLTRNDTEGRISATLDAIHRHGPRRLLVVYLLHTDGRIVDALREAANA